MIKKKSIFILLTIIFLFIGCNKPKIQYWPPSQYGEKLKKSEENFKNGKKDGISTYWHVNGNKQMECWYKDGKLNGILKRWYFNGNQERIDNYINDNLEGFSKTYFQDGTVESEVNYKNGILDGSYKLYWENGEMKISGEYINGLYNGKWIYYDNSGIKIGEAYFIKGNGEKKEFSIKSGLKNKETNFLKNKKDGIETYWDDSGKKIKELIYNEDIVIKTIIY